MKGSKFLDHELYEVTHVVYAEIEHGHELCLSVSEQVTNRGYRILDTGVVVVVVVVVIRHVLVMMIEMIGGEFVVQVGVVGFLGEILDDEA